jgi:hypothetical protein
MSPNMLLLLLMMMTMTMMMADVVISPHWRLLHCCHLHH